MTTGQRQAMKGYLNKELRQELAERALRMNSAYEFLNSLNRQEYRELSFFWQDAFTFFETCHGKGVN